MRDSKSPKTESLSPQLDELDAGWDALGSQPPSSSDPDLTNRPTIIPDIPLEAWAQRMMKVPETPDNANLAEEEEAPSGVHERATPVFSITSADIDALARPSSAAPRPSDPSAHAGLRPRPSQAPTARPAQPSMSARPATAMPDLALAALPQNFGDRSTGGPSLEVTAAETDTESAVLDMKDRHAMGDYSGALDVAETVLELVPDHSEAERYARNCREMLCKMYGSRLGALSRAPELVMQSDQVRWLSLDHRAGFLLSLVDGQSSAEEILDICGIPRLDALKMLCSLVEQNVIRFKEL